MKMAITAEERARIERAYGAAVPERLTITRVPRGLSGLPQPRWCEKTGNLVYAEKDVGWKRRSRADWMNRPARRAAEARRPTVATLHAEGLTAKEIAERVGVSLAAIYGDLEALKLKPNSRFEREARAAAAKAAAIVAEIRRLADSGLCATEVAAAMGLSVRKVSHVAVAAGFRLRRSR